MAPPAGPVLLLVLIAVAAVLSLGMRLLLPDA